MKILNSKCQDAGHADRCTAHCRADEARCAIGRKHFTNGGVCCISCFTSCVKCEGGFYTEHMNLLSTYDENDDDNGYYDSIVCHCCLLEAEPGREYKPWVDPLMKHEMRSTKK